MYFDAERDVGPSPSMINAVERGILARENRVKGAKVRKGVKGEEDEMFKKQIFESSWRMRMLIKAVEETMARRKRKAEEGMMEEVVDWNGPAAKAKMLADLKAGWDTLD